MVIGSIFINGASNSEMLGAIIQILHGSVAATRNSNRILKVAPSLGAGPAASTGSSKAGQKLLHLRFQSLSPGPGS